MFINIKTPTINANAADHNTVTVDLACSFSVLYGLKVILSLYAYYKIDLSCELARSKSQSTRCHFYQNFVLNRLSLFSPAHFHWFSSCLYFI